MTPFFSIVVPIYNASTFLRQCIESILDQTFSNFELILIDDGSTDNSLDICNEYMDKDKRIRIFSQLNLGVSVARNTGIRESTGKYLVFIDSDDYVDSKFLEYLAESDADYITLGYSDVFGDRVVNFIPKNYTLSISSDCDRISILEDKLGEAFVWAKRYKAEIIFEHNLQFNPEFKIMEDMLFNLQYISCIRSYQSIDKVGYFYRHYDELSLSKSVEEYSFLERNAVREYAFKMLKSHPSLQRLIVNQSIYYSEIEIKKISRSNIFYLKKVQSIKPIINQHCFQYALNSSKLFFPRWMNMAYKYRLFPIIIFAYNYSR